MKKSIIIAYQIYCSILNENSHSTIQGGRVYFTNERSLDLE